MNRLIGVAFGVPAILGIAACSDNTTTQPAVTVTAPTTTTPSTTATPEPMTVPDAVALVRSQGSPEFATWSDAAIERQFDETCKLLRDDWSFAYVVYSLTSRDIAPFNAHDAGTLVTGAVLSKCPEFTTYISNL